MKAIRKLCFLLLVICLLTLPTQSSVGAARESRATDIFVSPDGTGEDCTQALPCSAQKGLSKADHGDVVLFRQGTYIETTDPTMYVIEKGITLQGGWDGLDSTEIGVDPEAYPTIIDGQEVRRPFEINVAADQPVEITGFTIMQGFASVSGGGLLIRNGAVTIKQNTLSDNYSGSYGGAICILSKDGVTISENGFEYNEANEGGGGIELGFSSGVTIRDNRFNENKADFAGAIFSDKSEGTIIERNSIRDTNSSSVILVGTPDGGRVTVRNNIIDGAPYEYLGTQKVGNGIWIQQVSTEAHLVYHNTIVNVNSGLTAAHSPKIIVSNNIFAYNKQGLSIDTGAIITGTNNLFYQNTVSPEPNPLSNPIMGDPAFVDYAGSNFHITEESAALDAGAGLLVSDDVDGETRPNGASCDIGADEYYSIPHQIFLPLMAR